jgi:hypothetical protein
LHRLLLWRASRWKQKPHRRWERLVVSRVLHADSNRHDRAADAGRRAQPMQVHTSASICSVSRCASLARTCQRGTPMHLGIIKRTLPTAASRQYTLCSFFRNHNIDIAIRTALLEHYITLTPGRPAIHETETRSCNFNSPLLVLFVSVSYCFLIDLKEVSSLARPPIFPRWLLLWKTRLPVVCTPAASLHLHPNILIVALSTPAAPGRHPQSTISLCPHTSSVFSPPLFTLSSHHFFLTNTHQWPHSL